MVASHSCIIWPMMVCTGSTSWIRPDVWPAADDAAVFHVRVLEEHLAGRLAGHVLGHILEFAAGLLLGKDALGDFALIHARGVLERAQKQDRLHLVGVLDEVVFHGREHGALLGQQEAGAHVHAFGAEHERGCHLAAGRNAAGADDRNVKRLHTARREHHGAEIVLARVAGRTQSRRQRPCPRRATAP